MQRLNRSAHAPLGTAFFLFLGVAIVPISLRAAGVHIGFSPRLSAAVDAWQQIAEVFGASYRPGTETEMSALNTPANEPSSAADKRACSRRELACVREFEELSEVSEDVVEPRASKTISLRAACPKAPSRRSPAKPEVEPDVAAAAIQVSFKEHTRALEALRAIKLDTRTREGLLKSIDGQMIPYGFDPSGTIRSLPIPENLRMLIRVKPPVAPSAAKAAACKVRSAFASARKFERARTFPTSEPSTNPENAEL